MKPIAGIAALVIALFIVCACGKKGPPVLRELPGDRTQAQGFAPDGR